MEKLLTGLPESIFQTRSSNSDGDVVSLYLILPLYEFIKKVKVVSSNL